MLNLFKNDGMPVKEFDGYRELYHYITHAESLKIFENHPDFGASAWSFRVLSPERVAMLIQALRKEYDMMLLFEAWERGLPMLEMCEGDAMVQILVTPDIEVEILRNNWCLAWCKAHGLYAAETEAEPVLT
jgi:hypothetical protein